MIRITMEMLHLKLVRRKILPFCLIYLNLRKSRDSFVS
jgi:hypothetical protein